MNVFVASVTIQCSVDEVFGFYRNFENLPRFLGDVMAVQPAGPATTRWTIEGPFGIRTRWTIRVTEQRENCLIHYETVSSPGLRTRWEIDFAAGIEAGETEVREVMITPLGATGLAILSMMRKFPAAEMASNLWRFKEIMETGRVTDTSNAVAGKFR